MRNEIDFYPCASSIPLRAKIVEFWRSGQFVSCDIGGGRWTIEMESFPDEITYNHPGTPP